MSVPRPRPLPIPTRVKTVTSLSRSLVRIVLTGDGLAGFADPIDADSYVKIVFLDPDTEYPQPVDLARIRAEMPPAAHPRLRTYTVRAFDRDRGELTLDIVVHGDAGLAGPWAAAARPGDEVLITGPGGGYSPRPDSDWHLLAGDESALPAIAVALERIPADATVSAFVEVHGPHDRIDLARPVTWLDRGERPTGHLLVDAVRSWSMPAGRGQFFVHGEAGAVKQIRRHLRVDLGVALERLSISGYWREGADDEKWREQKRAWNREVDESERTAGAA